MEFIAKSINDLNQISKQLIEHFGTIRVILFNGEMGAGKTTLIKEICKNLGVSENTSSPTFSIVNEYQTDNHESIYHFDFYRLENEQEAMDFGYEDYFYSNSFCFIEWSEKIPNLIPENHQVVSIKIDNSNNRIISIAS
ncbi:tRNA (adenosine(37)-N6)-threonylcarbamoyltransferase complex ATPase subunit type 1 TsaE [Vicingus serpentipes]|uniref:tRNA threonylcarbamoyladenosine biosynthesis protein TsaE n=1 Tax=Vicingus serpentipes TaxID=1926625 RepID=A0A5C6RTE4_9FLAO|nr:tRNA (adenosine(37)-N6)-threonylcarbamoyltransferase complex ATPase subunit type 1 TsaE [Vicingus serpentipes]TXB65427.1 tRNA (adenosine(37)-N6)-threonylcarbamoyltransferase complex ATPase subunit type 1 TsaE [Vicingus serpentipes]